MRVIIVILLFIFCVIGYNSLAMETFTVRVTDEDGNPIVGAEVLVSTMNKVILFGSDSSEDFNKYTTFTDTNGVGVVRFNCLSSHFSWDVTANNCYFMTPSNEYFNAKAEYSSPESISISLTEHDIYREVKLYRKKNPQPMYGYTTSDKSLNAPYWNGRFGFDLQCFDWLPPLGKGVVADFYYVREMVEGSLQFGETNKNLRKNYFLFPAESKNYPKNGDIIGRIEFPEKGGAYIRKKTGNYFFQSTYGADLTAEYVSSLPIVFSSAGYNNTILLQESILEKDEYMVVRSRVECNENGEIISANYSKIHGEFYLKFNVGVESVIFNPRINDTNLEFDPNRNLYQGNFGQSNSP